MSAVSERMASFLAGPAAELVGLGMQAVGVGIPVSGAAAKLINGVRELGVPLPPKSWFKKRGEGPRDREEQRQTVYDKLEAHVNGVIQVVKPVIELKQMVREGCCRSADRDLRSRDRDRSPRSELRYYTPQKCTSGSSIYPPSTPEPRESSQKTNNNYIERWSVRRNSSYSDDESSCLHCSQSKSLMQLPCGRLICPECDKTADHHLTCKQCKKLAD